MGIPNVIIPMVHIVYENVAVKIKRKYVMDKPINIIIATIIVAAMLYLAYSNDDREDAKTYNSPKVTIVAEKPAPEGSSFKEGSGVKPTEPTEGSSDSYSWEAPKHWLNKGAGGMRVGSYEVDYDGAIKAEITLITLGPNSGSLTSNINRWRGQVELASLSEEEVKNSVETRTGKFGKFIYVKLVNDTHPDKAIAAAIYRSPDEVLFVKMTAPANAVNDLEKDFIAFCDSVATK